MDFLEDRVSHGQLMEGVFVNIYWEDNMTHIKGDIGKLKKFKLVRQWLHAWQHMKGQGSEELNYLGYHDEALFKDGWLVVAHCES
jgi:hypothetical protein